MSKGKIHIEKGNYRSVYNLIKKDEERYSCLSPFQDYSLYKFYKSQDNCEPFAFSGYHNDTLIVAVSGVILYEKGLKKQFTKRAIIYGGPVLDKTSIHVNKVLELLLKTLKNKLKRRAIYLEIRNSFDYACYTNIYLTNGYKYKPYVNYCLDISSLDGAIGRWSSEKRRQLKKAELHGAYVCVAESANHVEQFYAILKNLYQNRIKKPLPNLKFFLNLYFTFNKYRNGAFTLVCYQNKVIGGAICLYDNDTVYDWYRCGLDKDFKPCYPSVMAVYSGINKGIEQGCSSFDFMGAGMLNEPYGVRKFKSQFGGQLVEFGRYSVVLNPVRYAIGKVALSLKKLLG